MVGDAPTTEAKDRMYHVLARTWFPSLFAQELPLSTLLRVWDIFFAEGDEGGGRILFSVAVVCLQELSARGRLDGIKTEAELEQCLGGLAILAGEASDGGFGGGSGNDVVVGNDIMEVVVVVVVVVVARW